MKFPMRRKMAEAPKVTLALDSGPWVPRQAPTPTRTFVVLEARAHGQTVWAWCECGDEAGFNKITYTQSDGSSPVTASHVGGALGRFLFSVTVPVTDS
jgi:hypothetical protein